VIRDYNRVCPMLALEMQNPGDITYEKIEEYRTEEKVR
jgi:hypothetical protein